MRVSGLRGEKLIWIFFLSFLLISFPILTIFNVNVMVGPIPLLYVYIFLVWLGIIIAIYAVIGRTQSGVSEESDSRHPMGR